MLARLQPTVGRGSRSSATGVRHKAMRCWLTMVLFTASAAESVATRLINKDAAAVTRADDVESTLTNLERSSTPQVISPKSFMLTMDALVPVATAPDYVDHLSSVSVDDGPDTSATSYRIASRSDGNESATVISDNSKATRVQLPQLAIDSNGFPLRTAEYNLLPSHDTANETTGYSAVTSSVNSSWNLDASEATLASEYVAPTTAGGSTATSLVELLISTTPYVGQETTRGSSSMHKTITNEVLISKDNLLRKTTVAAAAETAAAARTNNYSNTRQRSSLKMDRLSSLSHAVREQRRKCLQPRITNCLTIVGHRDVTGARDDATHDRLHRRIRIVRDLSDEPSTAVDHVTSEDEHDTRMVDSPASDDVTERSRSGDLSADAFKESVAATELHLVDESLDELPQNDAAVSETRAGLSYRSRGGLSAAAASAALVDPINGRRPAGAAGSGRNRLGLRGTTVATTTPSVVQTTAAGETVYIRSTSLENDTENDLIIASSVTDHQRSYDTTLVALDGNEAMSTTPADGGSTDAQRCGGTLADVWSFMASFDQRHHSSFTHVGHSPDHRQQTALVTSNYTIGLLFSVILLWSAINLIVIFLSGIIPLCRRRTFMGSRCAESSSIDVDQVRCSFRYRPPPSPGAWTLISCSIVVLSTSRAVCFLAGGAARISHPSKDDENIPIVGVLFELAWPCLTTALVGYLCCLIDHCNSPFHASVDKIIGQSPLNRDLRIDGNECRTGIAPPTSNVKMAVVLSASILLPVYFVLTACLSIAVQLCIVRDDWMAVPRATFVCAAIMISIFCLILLRKAKSTSFRKSEFDTPYETDQHSVNCAYLFTAVVLFHGVFVAGETAAAMVSPVVIMYIRIPVSCLWWTSMIIQLAVRFLELVLCVMLCLDSTSQSIACVSRKTHVERRGLDPRHTHRPHAVLSKSSDWSFNGTSTDKMATVGPHQFYRLPLSRKHSGAAHEGFRVDVTSVIPPSTTATCRAALASNTGMQFAVISPYKRSRSMLYNDNGFIRFRLDCDPEVDSDARTLDNDDDDGPENANSRYAASASDVASVAAVTTHSAETHSNGRRPKGSDRGCNRLESSSSWASSSLFSFRAPSIDLQDSVERELDRCDIWRAAYNDDSGSDEFEHRHRKQQLGVDDRMLRMMKLYADVGVTPRKTGNQSTLTTIVQVKETLC